VERSEAFDCGILLRHRCTYVLLASSEEATEPENFIPDFACYCGSPDPGTDGVCRCCNGATYRLAPSEEVTE
jgi:hypothetical protein